jgi:hypothetical protein
VTGSPTRRRSLQRPAATSFASKRESRAVSSSRSGACSRRLGHLRFDQPLLPLQLGAAARGARARAGSCGGGAVRMIGSEWLGPTLLEEPCQFGNGSLNERRPRPRQRRSFTRWTARPTKRSRRCSRRFIPACSACCAGAGRLPEEDSSPTDPVAEQMPQLAQYASASIQGLVASGPRAGHPVRRLRSAAAVVDGAKPRCARLKGFSLHADVGVPAHARGRLEHLCRYLLRSPLALER